MKEINVIGTMQLLAACQKADSLTKLVVQSSVSVYGASPATRSSSPRRCRAGPAPDRFGKDAIESSPTSAASPGAP